ncbi:PilX_N domain-containing protein [Rubrivivax sp. A210]|uniref:hypothetical protein n=1 Tax=Rubrivivax sp. A210 TaxID=2772301 RepID=UPI001918D773|nr:hypothetical protein [Rubrivivax sp. A210]CAD5371844.1 PilX_N domain-containing protein [Rubrivivax sp. A210]
MKPGPRASQRGVTLIMLVAMAMLAGWSVRSGIGNLRIVGNTQARQEAFAAAQAAIETTISTPMFSQQPAAVAANPLPIDVDGDGRADMTATLTPVPACYRWRAVPPSELDPAVAADRACMGSGAAGNAGLESAATGGAIGGASLCADSEWNVRAVVSDEATRASVRVNQGVAIRGLVTDVVNSCE